MRNALDYPSPEGAKLAKEFSQHARHHLNVHLGNCLDAALQHTYGMYQTNPSIARPVYWALRAVLSIEVARRPHAKKALSRWCWGAWAGMLAPLCPKEVQKLMKAVRKAGLTQDDLLLFEAAKSAVLFTQPVWLATEEEARHE
jgi:hypothetical protein